MRILGFGDQTHYQAGFARRRSHPWLHGTMTGLLGATLWMQEWSGRVFGKLGRILGRK